MAGVAASGQAVAGAASFWGGVQGVLVGASVDSALEAVEALRPLVPEGATMAAFALRWILMDEAVTVVIPGARTAAQALGNIAAATLPALPQATLDAVAQVYDQDIRPHVHQRW